MKKAIIALIFAGIGSAAFAENLNLAGRYYDLSCRPSDLTLGCSSIEIDSENRGTGTLFAGDIRDFYRISKRAVNTVDGVVFILTIHGEDAAQLENNKNGNSGWVFLPKAKKLISVDGAIVLTRSER